jgi:predicted Zn-dependent protease
MPFGLGGPGKRCNGCRMDALFILGTVFLTYLFWLHYTGPVSASAIFPRLRVSAVYKGAAMRSTSGLSLTATALALVVVLATVGCGKVNQLKGAKAYKAANAAYQTQDYKKAAELYQEAVDDDPNYPAFAPAYFFLGNSYDNLWKPSKKGDPENDKLLQDAVKNYQLAADKLMASDNPEFKKYGKLSLQYLVAAYGAEKLDDAGKAEPILQHMIELEPADPANYFMLARLYDDAGEPAEAERMYIAAKDARPNDPSVYMSLAAHYNQLGQFDKTIDALEQRASKEPDNPEAYQTIASYYWDKANKDSKLKENEKRDYVLKGIASVDRALQIKPDYAEGMVYKGLLLRLQANLEKDAAKQQALIKEAVSLHDRAEEIRKKKAAGA